MNVLQMSISAGLLILAIIILRALSINRLPKKMFVALWGIAILRLLIPFTITLQYKTTNLFTAIPGQVNDLVQKSAAYIPTNAVPAAGAGIETVSAAVKQIPLFQIIWMIGMLICFLYFLFAYIKEYRKLREAIPINGNEYLNEWVNEVHLERKIIIMGSDRITTPVTYGIFSPKIVLPQIMDLTDVTALKYVLEHELVHIKRLDNLWKSISLVTLCIHWFNPLVWILYLLFGRDLELSCDEKVIAISGSEQRQAYALTLISLAEKKSGSSFLHSGFGKNAIKERIVAIMKYKKATIISFMCVIILLAAAAIFVFASPDKKTESAGKLDTEKNTEFQKKTSVSQTDKADSAKQSESITSGTAAGQKAETETSETETSETQTSESAPTIKKTETEKQNQAPKEVPANNSYIFPDSSTAILSDDTIRRETMAQLERARNEIFARHGRIFKEPSISDYFNSQAWYVPSVEPENFDAQVTLNEFEQTNLQKIMSVEEENKELTNNNGFIGVLGSYNNGSSGRLVSLEITAITADAISFQLGINNTDDPSDSFLYEGSTGTIIHDTHAEAEVQGGGFTIALDWSSPGTVTISCIGGTVPDNISVINNQVTLWNSRYMHTS